MVLAQYRSRIVQIAAAAQAQESDHLFMRHSFTAWSSESNGLRKQKGHRSAWVGSSLRGTAFVIDAKPPSTWSRIGLRHFPWPWRTATFSCGKRRSASRMLAQSLLLRSAGWRAFLPSQGVCCLGTCSSAQGMSLHEKPSKSVRGVRVILAWSSVENPSSVRYALSG